MYDVTTNRQSGHKQHVFNQVFAVWPRCLHPPSDSSTANQKRLIGRYSSPLALYAHHDKAVVMMQNGLEYNHKSAK